MIELNFRYAENAMPCGMAGLGAFHIQGSPRGKNTISSSSAPWHTAMAQGHALDLATTNTVQSLNQQLSFSAHALDGGCAPVHGAGLCSSVMNRFARVQLARSVFPVERST